VHLVDLEVRDEMLMEGTLRVHTLFVVIRNIAEYIKYYPDEVGGEQDNHDQFRDFECVNHY
jgi:hypothetical protein